MFINVSEELQKAKEEKYAIGAFNTSNLEATKAICRAAKAMLAPVIIQTTPSAIKYAGLQQIFSIVKNEIEASGVMASIHLDHAKEFEIVRQAIDTGYRSVMIDGSHLSFSENIALTRKVVEYAHPKNVSVEGEIGVISSNEGGEGLDGEPIYSSPEKTKQFVEITGVDSVAVSIGNQHGAPKDEHLNLDLLRQIANQVKIPLVVHGGSGLSREDIEEAIRLGVAKVNIDTKIRRAFLSGLREIPEDATDYRDVMISAMESIESVVKESIGIFGSESKSKI